MSQHNSVRLGSGYKLLFLKCKCCSEAKKFKCLPLTDIAGVLRGPACSQKLRFTVGYYSNRAHEIGEVRGVNVLDSLFIANTVQEKLVGSQACLYFLNMKQFHVSQSPLTINFHL